MHTSSTCIMQLSSLTHATHTTHTCTNIPVLGLALFTCVYHRRMRRYHLHAATVVEADKVIS